MMYKPVFVLFVLGLLISSTLYAQDTLPDFTVKNYGKKRTVVSWKNNYPLVKQIGIQRSADSLKNFKTILTVTDPMLPENGYFDNKALTDSMYYRLFIVLDKDEFLFTAPQRPMPDTAKKLAEINTYTPAEKLLLTEPKNSDIFVPSPFVFTQKDGYVQIKLPDAESKKFSIRFFEEDDSFLFELKEIKRSSFKIDRTNFYHAGWFKFELDEDGKLIEKHKFYLAKDF